MADGQDLTTTLGPRPWLIGMVHLCPLPGAPGDAGDWPATLAAAVRDAEAIAAAGFSAVLVENFNDAPFHPDALPPETCAALAVAAREVAKAVRIPVGVNALRNDAATALSAAVAAGGRFIRVNVHTGAAISDQGVLTGRAHETLRLRRRLGSAVAILADVHVKHAAPLGGISLEQAARDCFQRGRAEALIVSGPGTGAATSLEDLRRVKAAMPEAPVLVGSGATLETVAELLATADGVIVGSAIMVGGRAGGPVDPERASAFIRGARGA